MTREEYRREQNHEQNTLKHRHKNNDHQGPYQQNNFQPQDFYQEPRPKHHFGRKALICVFCIFIGIFGYSWYTQHEAEKSSQLPRTYTHRVTNNTTVNKTAPQKKPSKSEENVHYLKNQMQKLQLSQDDTQAALDKFKSINPTQQTEVINKLKAYKQRIPSTFMQREVAKQVLNQLNSQENSQTNNNQN